MKPNLKTVNKLGFFFRWLPVTGSVTLMVMICVVSALSFSQLKTANSWHEHSYKVLATAQTFLNDLFRIQGDARNYVFTGQAALLKTFRDIIREKLGAKCPAIFALTAEALEGDKERFLGLGFDGYLSKPLQTHTLQETLKTVNSSTQLAKV